MVEDLLYLALVLGGVISFVLWRRRRRQRADAPSPVSHRARLQAMTPEERKEYFKARFAAMTPAERHEFLQRLKDRVSKSE